MTTQRTTDNPSQAPGQRPRGRLHVYTGDGKGKTTAAVGLAVRAAGAGLRVAFLQFDKGFSDGNEHYSERGVLRSIPGIDVHCFGAERIVPGGRFRFANIDDDFAQAGTGLATAKSLLAGGNHDVVICDEAVTCVMTGLLSKDDIMEIVAAFQSTRACELVLTGRGAFAELVDAADLVSEIHPTKHYFSQGQIARRGIDF